MIDSLRPRELRHVYDLVREAGLDVSDWANYKRPESPQTNPKYCYEWAFDGGDRVVVCLWFDDMKEDETGIFQLRNGLASLARDPQMDPVRRRRIESMNGILSKAFRRQLPVRVIVVHDPENRSGDRKPKLRSLDAEVWRVVSYDDQSGWCRLQRGGGGEPEQVPGILGMAAACRLSMVRFQSELENLKEHLLEVDGVPFESFTRGKLYDWESYKDYVFTEAGQRLQWKDWKLKEVGSGTILDRVIHAIEIDDGKKKRNNLLQWKKYGVHRILTEVRNDQRCFQVESLHFDFYTGELEPEEAFDSLVAQLGKKYPLIAYLFFIKDCSRFLPIAPETFDALFARLGVNLRTNGRCGWENYAAYLGVIEEVRQLLEMDGIPGVRLLDAHSFCWLLASLAPVDESRLKATPIVEVESSADLQPGNPSRQVDWEALHRARAMLGRLGEELACKAEKERLIQAGYPDLAERIAIVGDDHTKGYDLHSYELDGSDRFIEVKTMGAESGTIRFYTTRRQLELAHSGVNHFYYLVLGARTQEPRIVAMRAESIPAEAINPLVHEVVFSGGLGEVLEDGRGTEGLH